MTYDESGRAARCRVVTALLAVVLIVLVGANLCIGMTYRRDSFVVQL